jgi:hypothetical protein
LIDLNERIVFNDIDLEKQEEVDNEFIECYKAQLSENYEERISFEKLHKDEDIQAKFLSAFMFSIAVIFRSAFDNQADEQGVLPVYGAGLSKPSSDASQLICDNRVVKKEKQNNAQQKDFGVLSKCDNDIDLEKASAEIMCRKGEASTANIFSKAGLRAKVDVFDKRTRFRIQNFQNGGRGMSIPQILNWGKDKG